MSDHFGDADVAERHPLVMSLVEDRAHAGEVIGADAAIEAVAEDLASDVDDDGDDGD
ncbi:MAG: hypothetical protein IV086_18040 [Hyphomonadaceae bacterium]|nr:MAG: hypothetical protein FD160_948 [Caulobacteraceae bacterium]MBT9447601.1 hypothetical protein [Hyphomonadaceae bacterium]TPW08628.1 MAG: hypothetical protein FD124_250 [Alphaproteobacteria bacterium]